MTSKNNLKYALAFAGLVALSAPGNAVAASSEIENLRKTVEMLQSQLQDVQKQLNAQERKSASKAEMRDLKEQVLSSSSTSSSSDRPFEYKFNDSIVHLAGYGAAGYADNDSAGERFNQVRFAPIFHYQYKDLFMVESELEFEIEADGGTDVAMEYLTIDLLLNDYVAVSAGKFISPIGQFRQNIHPSWINKLPSAPPGFGHDGAAPIADVGIQLRGGFPVGDMRTNYAFFVGNGPEIEAITEGGDVELEGIMAEGFTRDADDSKVTGGRFAVLPVPELEIGVSGAIGQATVTVLDDGAVNGDANRDYSVFGADFAWQRKGMGFRGEYIKSKIGDDAGSIAPEGADWSTWYLQASYLIPSTKWEGVLRYTDFDSPHGSEDQKQWAFGINYLFANNVIAKAGYEFNDGLSGADTDNNTALLQLAYGF
jgi:hypothetical protein